MHSEHKRLGELLTDVGWIGSEQLTQALRAQEVLGGRLGSCLLEVDAITEDQLLRALSHQLGVRSARIKDLQNVPPEVHRLIPRELAVEHCAVPFRVLGAELSIALLEVHDRRRYEELAAAAGKGVCVFVGNEARVFAALESYYELPMSERFRQLHARLDAQAAQRQMLGAKEPTYDHLQPTAYSADAAADDAAASVAGHGQTAAASSAPPPVENDREAIAARLVDDLAARFQRVLLFRIQKDSVLAWRATGRDIDLRQFEELSVSLAEPSVFFSLRGGSRYYRGPFSPMPSHRRIAACWGGAMLDECMVLPIRIQRRLVSAVLLDPGDEGIEDGAISDLEKTAEDTAAELERYILQAKNSVQGPND